MSPELARAALAFLSRTDLKGVEAPTMVQVGEALQALAEGRVRVFPCTAPSEEIEG